MSLNEPFYTVTFGVAVYENDPTDGRKYRGPKWRGCYISANVSALFLHFCVLLRQPVTMQASFQRKVRSYTCTSRSSPFTTFLCHRPFRLDSHKCTVKWVRRTRNCSRTPVRPPLMSYGKYAALINLPGCYNNCKCTAVIWKEKPYFQTGICAPFVEIFSYRQIIDPFGV